MHFPLETDVVTAAKLHREGAILLDVREPGELAIAQVPSSLHIPMPEVPSRLADVPADKHVLVLCHHGGRSARVTQFLRASGLTKVTNVAGGIDAWALEVEPSLNRY